ncbi:MAG TPA: hypothetical protein VIT92_05710 [Burkholderiaceae bacterium]
MQDQTFPAPPAFGWRLCFVLIVAISISACGGGGGGPGPQLQNLPPAAIPSIVAPVVETLPRLSAAPTTLALHTDIGTPAWPDGSSATGGAGQPVAGINCMPPAHAHSHTHITLLRDGVQLALPANIGMQGCIYELHTHDESGVVHVEVQPGATANLGQFFAVWGRPLARDNVAGITGLPLTVFLIDDGKVVKYEGDLAAIELKPRRDIALVFGEVPAGLPSYLWDPSL